MLQITVDGRPGLLYRGFSLTDLWRKPNVKSSILLSLDPAQRNRRTGAAVRGDRAMSVKINPATAPLSVLKALAMSLARDIDRGATELREELERVMSYVPTAKVQS